MGSTPRNNVGLTLIIRKRLRLGEGLIKYSLEKLDAVKERPSAAK